MDHDTSQSKPKRKKNVLSDSEEDELVKKHKTVRSDDESEKEDTENSQMTKDVTGSSEPMEEKQNGKYKELPTRNMSDSDSAGTDVELTSDEETQQNYQKSRKKRRISIKSERKIMNDVQHGSSSESEDDQPNSPKSPSSVKKFYRKRRNFSGNKSHGKLSSDSENYKTESDSDNEPLKQKSRKDSGTPHNRRECTKSNHESPQMSKKCDVKALKNEVETESSSLEEEDNSNFQKKTKYSSSEDSKSRIKKQQNLSDDNKNNDPIKSAKKFASKNSGSSSDEWIDPTRRQRERELRRQKKRGNVLKGNTTPTKAKTLMKSNDNVTLNSDSEKSSDDNSRPKIKEEDVPLNSDILQEEKGIKQEELSSDSGSEASEKQISLNKKQERKNSETKRRSSSATSSSSEASDKQTSVKGKLKIENSETKRRSSSPTSSSEASDKQASVKDKIKKENSKTKRRSNSPTSSSSHKKQRDNSSSSSESEKKKSVKRQKNKLPDEDKRIISLKKYLKTAGIRVHNYSELWKDCRSNKARAQKMLSLLEQNGLKGRPTIEKCKKLRKKIETRKEVEELDLSNVMDCGEGRTRRSRLKSAGSQELSPDYAQQKATEIRGRLKLLADSDSE